MFLKAKLLEFHLDPDSLYPVVQPRPDPVAPKVPQIQPPGRLLDTAKSWLNWMNPFGSRVPAQELPKPRNEEDADAIDALAPIYDMLDIKPQWLIFEAFSKFKLPRTLKGPISLDLATKSITQAHVKVHRTVITRMRARHADGSSYVPKALFPDKKPLSLNTAFTGDEAKFVIVD